MSDEMIIETVAILFEAYCDGVQISDELLDWMNKNGAGIEYLES